MNIINEPGRTVETLIHKRRVATQEKQEHQYINLVQILTIMTTEDGYVYIGVRLVLALPHLS